MLKNNDNNDLLALLPIDDDFFIHTQNKPIINNLPTYANTIEEIFPYKLAILDYAKKFVPNIDWFINFPSSIQSIFCNNKSILLSLKQFGDCFTFEKLYLTDDLTYYEFTFSSSALINCSLSDFPKTTAYGFDNTSIIFNDYITELTKYHIKYIRYMEKNKGEKFNTLDDLDRIFKHKNNYLSYPNAINKLAKKYDEVFMDSFQSKRIQYLAGIFSESSLSNCKIGLINDKINSSSNSELQLYILRLKLLFDLTNCLVTINEASNKTSVNEGTIKHACQTNRLVNTKKIGKTWLVDLDEINQVFKNLKESKNNQNSFNFTISNSQQLLNNT